VQTIGDEFKSGEIGAAHLATWRRLLDTLQAVNCMPVLVP